MTDSKPRGEILEQQREPLHITHKAMNSLDGARMHFFSGTDNEWKRMLILTMTQVY